ncbi:MAG TPA: hypothetical protein VFZ21_05530 [Gemmatimonadaceae bacterium]|nr:hypothetical protein [Gemmatimonadaceae bacterium]
MKAFAFSLLALVIPVWSASAQRPDPGKLFGRWSGTGTFFSADLRKKVDSIPFELEIDPDRAGKGRVGEVLLSDVLVKPNRNYLEVRGRLARPISSDPALDKDRLVLVITELGDSTMNAEFHLKTNFVYDLTMREGRVALTRTP